MFVLFFLYNYYLFLREYIRSRGKLGYENQIRWGRDIYKFNEWLYKWKQIIHKKSYFTNNNKILLLSNHQNLVDGLNIQHFLFTYYSTYRPIIVMKKGISKLWLFGKYMKENHILIENDYEKDLNNIKEVLHRYKNEKIIVLLFPEGSVYNDDNIPKSNEWCKKQNIPPYQSCMCPRTKGLYAFINAFRFDTVLQCYITYPDDIKREKAIYYKHYLINKLPRISEIYIKNITSMMNDIRLLSFEDFSTRIYKYWREVDNHLTQTYKEYETKYIEFINHKHIYHDVVIDYVELTWNSSKYIIIVIPIAYLTHGYFYCLSLITLLLTSYQYHIHKKWKYFDIFMACLLIMLSYVYNTHLHSNIFLTIGIGFYLIEKLIEFHFKMNNNLILYYLHTMLHMFAYTHILVEFLYHYM